MKNKKIPPKTKRYCTICQKEHWYIYDKVIGHSYCSGCKRSSMFSRREKPKVIKNDE